MKTLPSAITNLKNQLAVSGAWLTLMDIVNSGTVKHRYVNDTYDLIFPTDGNTYSKASFQIQQITEELQMALPKITITIYDPELNLRAELQDNAGMSGWNIILRRVYKTTGETGVVTDVVIRQEFTILDVAMEDTTISLSVGVADPLSKRFPRDRYAALACRHKYKGGFCRYVSTRSLYSSNGISFGKYAGFNSIKDTANGFLSKLLKNMIIQITGTTAYMLRSNITINVSGSSLNNGILIAPSSTNYPVYQDRIYVTTPVNTESAGASISLLIINTFSNCTHTLEDASDGTPGCRSHNNSHQFGGSPGAAEGIFYDRRE